LTRRPTRRSAAHNRKSWTGAHAPARTRHPARHGQPAHQAPAAANSSSCP